MGLLDDVLGSLSRQQGQPGQQGGAAEGGLAQMVTGFLGGSAAQGSASGGLHGLMEQFSSAGLGHVFQSWVGNGPNQPIAPEDLNRAMGEDRVQGMAAQTGMAPSQFLPLLAQCLPTLIDQLTPHGHLPQAAGSTEQAAEHSGGETPGEATEPGQSPRVLPTGD
jgi:uncharacterized protein YidB (DUF937 family)